MIKEKINSQLQKKIEKLNMELESIIHHARVEQNDIKNIRRKQRIQKLIRAGLIFEKAGILDDYDEEKIFLILSKSKGEMENGK